MKLGLLLLPLVAAHSLVERGCAEKKKPDTCCCMSYKNACTMNTERMYHVKLYYNRKPGITPEEFNRYWAYEHAPLAEQFHLRLGVQKYMQVIQSAPTQVTDRYLTMCKYHSTPDFRALIGDTVPILEFDGAAEFWVHRIETMSEMINDPFYIEQIGPDEANFIDASSMRMVVGVDYIVVDNGNLVEEHGRRF
jgi:hypothetical protein